MRVFLSYRRSDVGGHAGRLADSLTRRLGPRSVFQDVATVGPGQDFAAAIDHALGQCDALLAVIGPGWLMATDASGSRRLAEPRDYVRVELARALRREVRVAPVLVGGASLPRAEELPPDLQALVLRQAAVLHDETWHEDVDGLVRSLRGQPAGQVRRSRRRLLAAGTLVVVLAGSAVALWHPWEGSGGSRVVPQCAPTVGPQWTPIVLGPDPRGAIMVDDGALEFTVRSGRWRPLGSSRWEVMLRTEMANTTAESRYWGWYTFDYLAVSLRENAPTCFQATPELVAGQKVGDATVGFEVSCRPTGYLELGLTYGSSHDGTLDVTPPSASTEC